MHVQELWEREQLNVLFHSVKYHKQIQTMMKGSPSIESIQKLIDEALAVRPSPTSMKKALLIVWSHFKRAALIHEEETFEQLIEKKQFDKAIQFLQLLSEKYKVKTLTKSHLFQHV